MSPPAVNTHSSRQLSGLLERATRAIEDALSALIDTDVQCRDGQLSLTAGGSWLRDQAGTPVLVTASLGDAHGNKSIHFLFDAPTAAVLSGHMMMAPKEAIVERRDKGSMTAEDLEAFGDVASVICSGAQEALRDASPTSVEIRLKEHRYLDPASAEESPLGDGTCLQYTAPIAIADHPRSEMHIILDIETAEIWNTHPIDSIGQPRDSSHDGAPDVPVRGTMATYLIDPHVMDVVRESSRRIGLELERHSSSAIPNPAAHRGQLVLMDITAGEERRFEWCKRLSEDPDVKTILIIHHPSKPRVLQGFAAKADAILGWPLSEADLSDKLARLLDGSSQQPDGEDTA